ncbi:MAG TPA: DUF2721 domain-containing protein [Sphingomonadaceae bacterium]|nr:DUF2721 domain-containing protein [Sphingomonadaceae bacterium]
MHPVPAAADLAHTIQLAVAPVFLLSGIGAFLNVLAGRLSRIIDRARLIGAAMAPAGDPEHDRQVWELRLLDRRIRYAIFAIALCTTSAVLICLVVAGIFVADNSRWLVGRYVAAGFISAMVLLIAGLICFLLEVRVAYRTIRVRAELLEHRKTDRAT